jgi:23S rRNA (adenine2030-N6)-methyltransferase
MFIVNPPWTLTETLRQTMPWLVDVLAQDQEATFLLETS